MFQDNGNPENIAVVSVKEEGAACGAGLSPVQPSSPYQLGRLGVLRHRMLRLGPDWAVITGTNPDMMARTKDLEWDLMARVWCEPALL